VHADNRAEESSNASAFAFECYSSVITILPESVLEQKVGVTNTESPTVFDTCTYCTPGM
jgi:hypothetical protein